MTTPEIEEREKVEAKSLGEKLHEACCPVVSVWARLPADTRSVYEANALRFAASLTHDETVLAVIAAQAEEIARLRTESDARYLKGLEAAARATSAEAERDTAYAMSKGWKGRFDAQAETITELVDALKDAALNFDACAVAIKHGRAKNCHTLAEGWAERARSAASKALPDTGEQGQ